MKIVAFVEGAYERAGGVGMIGVPYICRSLAARGHDVILNTAGSPILGTDKLLRSAQSELNGVRFDILCFRAYGKWAFAPSLPASVLEDLRTTDFISLHSLYSFPVLCGYLMSKLFRIPYGVWPHGVLAPFQRTVGRQKKAIYNSLFARRILDEASVIFYSAAGERDEAADLKVRAPSVVVPHGIDVSPYLRVSRRGQFRGRYFDGHSGPLVLYIGRLNAKKGLDLLIDAFAQVFSQEPDARLAIVGGPDPPGFEGELASVIDRYNLKGKVRLTGRISEDDKADALADADLLVLPSRAENFGFAMFEGMASGLPVVVSNTLNFAFEVEQSKAGIVCDRFSACFAEGIISLIKNPELRRKMGGNGHRLTQRYSWDRTGLRVEQTIQCILAGVPLPQPPSEGI